MEAMKTALGLDIVHVPYKGMGQAVPALLGGQVAMVPSALPAVEAHVKAGTVKLVAISTAKRSPLAPEIPTIAESGAPGYDFAPEIGLLAPAGTPPAIVARLSSEVAKAVRSPDIVERFRQLGIDPVGNSPEAYNAQIRAAYAKYGQVVKSAGVKAD
jgi:tripartite-type tricarboxylate transporter receptor subunit TctC